MPQPVILVTGANGQLGMEIRSLSVLYPAFRFAFSDREDLPIHSFEKVQQYFEKVLPSFCINCAAYTAVDKAETEKEMAMLVNGEAVGVLATVCKSFDTKFIHISTDYVFDGSATVPYREDHIPDPVNYYGATKLSGEERCFENNSDGMVIRTSWVYSEYGNNFVKTMIRLMKERNSLNVVNDQLGSPTYAADLARLILTIVEESHSATKKWLPGIYHFSNEGVISWYDFAVAIKNLTQSACVVNPVPSSMYPTAAKRPAYSVFNKEKIKTAYPQVQYKEWMTSLSEAIERLQP
ncbi:MAG: dTDP-4-dehydrorhamnose reductase [Chitinophagaceae bacterium]